MEEPAPGHVKQYAALRSDLSAALSAFDRAQDWAVSLTAPRLADACIAQPERFLSRLPDLSKRFRIARAFL